MWVLRHLWKILAGLLVVVTAASSYLIWTTDFGGTAKAATLVNLAYTALTGFLVFVAFAQIENSRDAAKATIEASDAQRRKWATLQACDRYDADPVLASAVRFLRRYHPFGTDRLKPPGYSENQQQHELSDAGDPTWRGIADDQRYTMSAGLLLNYFDSIAIGINQRFYDEPICRDHIGPIVLSWIDTLRAVDPKVFDMVMDQHYQFTKSMVARWQSIPQDS